MTIDVTTLYDRAEWNSLVDRCSSATPFHRSEALEVIRDHSGGTFYPLVGHKGEEPVGLFPIYGIAKGPFTLAVSPPPDLEISYMGPAQFDHGGMKRRKAERQDRRFIDAAIESVTDALSPDYTHIRAGTGYQDPRPFIWNDFDTTPRHTYHVDITPDTEELFMSFSSDIRSNVRNADENHDYDISEGGTRDIERIIRKVRERHEEQDVGYSVPASFATDLFEAMPDGMVRVYTLRCDGAHLGGLITLEDEKTLYRWQSVAVFDHDIAVSDVLDWELIKRAKDRGIEQIDLVGANNKRLCGYKSKFNPEVKNYYTLERGSAVMNFVKSTYLRLQKM